MKKIVLTTLALALTLTISWSQGLVIEDFENGGQLSWNDGEGEGEFSIVDNPVLTDTLADPLGINSDGSVGQYVKQEGSAFSLLLARLDQPLDLSTNNRFTVQFFMPKAGDVIFKLEGPGQAVEDRVTIPTGGAWRAFTFDLSAGADLDSLNTVLLFFDPGIAETSDTFLFDNITALPADECAGVAEEPGIIDDFDCQRNVPLNLFTGLLDLTIVDNPDPDDVNGPSQVGEYRDTFGGFHAYVYNYVTPIDLTERNVLKFKVWAPVTGRLLTKLEGGTSPAVERDVQVEETQTWVEYTVDYSDLAGANYTRLVFFFNAGQDGNGDIYYLDDFRWEEPPMGEVLEDFEDGPNLFWEPLNGNTAVHGTFSVIANPDMTGNESENVGSYTKGSSAFSTLTATLNEGLDLSTFSQLNLDVWAPTGSQSITMQLVSATQGVQEVTRDVTANEEWIELNFNFEDFSSITDFFQVNLIFDGGTASSDTYFFDNLSLGAGTVDPCEGVEPIAFIVDDFDCQRNVMQINADNDIEIIDNPDDSGDINNNPLDKVARYTDPPGPFSNIGYQYDGPIDLSFRNQLVVRIWSPEIVPMGFKLEGGSGPDVEQVVEVPVAEEWVEYRIDFSEQAMEDFTRLILFLNFGNEPTGQVYFVDDIQWDPAPYDACVVNFEEPNFTLTDWGYFANGDPAPEFTFIENPDKSDINPSDSVGVFIESADGPGVNTFAGLTTLLPAPIALPNDNKTISMKVWGPVAGQQVAKVENRRSDNSQSGDVFADYTTPGEWQELTFDYSAVVADDGLYDRYTIILGFGETPTEERIWYFDDVEIAGSSCNMVTSVFNPVRVEELSIMPNPVNDILFVQGTDDINHFEIFNSLGQRIRIIKTNQVSGVELNVGDLDQGIYTLAAFDRSGALIGNARFVKN